MKLKQILLAVMVLCLTGAMASAQQVTVDARQMRLDALLDQISEQTGCSFYYSRPMVNPDSLCTISASNEELSAVLDRLFADSGITYDIKDDKVYLVSRTAENASGGGNGKRYSNGY